MSIHDFRHPNAPKPPVIDDKIELFHLLVEAAGPGGIDHHESDLYVVCTEATRAIVNRWRFRCNATHFRSEVDGRCWIDLPFCYWPYWERVARISNRSRGGDE